MGMDIVTFYLLGWGYFTIHCGSFLPTPYKYPLLRTHIIILENTIYFLLWSWMVHQFGKGLQSLSKSSHLGGRIKSWGSGYSSGLKECHIGNPRQCCHGASMIQREVTHSYLLTVSGKLFSPATLAAMGSKSSSQPRGFICVRQWWHVVPIVHCYITNLPKTG
jgi:hypothetical protein